MSKYQCPTCKQEVYEGWFVYESKDEEDGSSLFLPVLTLESGTHEVCAPFNTKAECEEFIRRGIIGKGMLAEDK